MAADVRLSGPAAPGGRLEGREAFKGLVGALRGAFHDMTMTIDDQHVDGEVVVTEWTSRAVHLGPLMGIPPTGRPVTVHEMSCHRVVDGRVAESWIGDNVPRILLDIGALVQASGSDDD